MAMLPVVTGASLDESLIERTLHVPSAHFADLGQAFLEAHRLLVDGTSVRILIEPGTYRESVLGLDWSHGKAAETPLVIEGRGEVVWSGSDLFPPKRWKREGELLSHRWPHRWGNFAWSWGPKSLIGHRSELMFVNGKPLYPRILETYEVTGIKQDPAVINQVAYRYTGLLDPASTLASGQFGVIERAKNGPRIVFRPPPGFDLASSTIEVGVRKRLLDLSGKHDVVLRGIIFQHCANDDREYGYLNPVTFGRDAQSSRNVLIDRCRFLWNSGTGLMMAGRDWTIRDCEFSFNGFSGLAGGKTENALWQRNTTNFNVWRAWRGGELGYFTGGFKLHETRGHRIEGHTAIGNCTMGAWWDVHCHDVVVNDLTAIGNAANVQFELCTGPLWGERWLVAAGKAGDGQVRFWEHGHTTLRHSILYSDYAGAGDTALYNLRWFGRDDPHSAMNRLVAGRNLAEGCLFVAGPNVPNFGMMDDIRGPEWTAREPMTYVGRRNWFWRAGDPDFHRRWILDEYRTGELAARRHPIADWMRPGTYLEESPTLADPGLVDPAGYDFRFREDSPLWAKREQYPQIRLSPELLAQWRWFTQWSGYQPDVWNEPTGD